jgi:PTS system mannose-specific IIB component
MTGCFPFVRIDNRLLHGQVVQFWIPYLKVSSLIIADDLAASNPAMVSVYRMAIPRHINLSVLSVTELGDAIEQEDCSATLVVVSDIFDLARAEMSGFDFDTVTIGNVHAAKGRNGITDAVHLTPEEVEALLRWHKAGKKIEIQTFPGHALIMNWSQEGVRWLKF